MEGSDYEDKYSQWADDVKRTSNRRRKKSKSEEKRIGVNHNITPLLSLRLQQGYLRTHRCCMWVHCQGCLKLHWLLHCQCRLETRSNFNGLKRYGRQGVVWW